MTPSVFDRANAVGKYAAKLIFDLQREYTAESGSNARSRARLARLRRDLDGTAPTWMSIGEELFAQWPQELEAPADDSPEFDRQVNAVKVALELVTIHAQGMTYGTQSSVFETGIDDTLSLNSVMFRHDYSGIASVLDVVKCTDGAVLALSQFVRNLRAASGDKGKSTETAEQVREWAYADLDGLFRDEFRLIKILSRQSFLIN